jgi:hypothetical protein
VSNPYRISRQGHGVASFAGGGELLFDLADLPLILKHTWHLGKRGYPATHTRRGTVVLHRLLFPEADGMEIDHINGDKLDNRRVNLRACTHQQNGFNQKRRHTNTSGFIGVSFAPRLGCYEAYIHHNRTKHHLGLYADPATAARVRDCVARLLFGEYARLNFPRKAGRRHGSG